MEYFDTRISIIYWKLQYGVPVTTEETAQLAAWEKDHPDQPLHEMQQKELRFHQSFRSARLSSMSTVLEKAKAMPAEESPVQTMRTVWYRRPTVIAAAIVGSVTIGLIAVVLYGLQDVKRRAAAPVVQYVRAYQPSDTAVWIELTDGSHLPVGTNDTGVLVRQGSVQLRSQGAGQLVFEADAAGTGAGPLQNKITNLVRKPIRIQLPDNSVVQLDATAQLHVNIDGSTTERSVSLTGIAYFTVTHDAGRPFTVHANGTTIQVMGTEFAVNTDDRGKTTVGLTKGSVSVTHGDKYALLKPGDVISVKSSGEFQWRTSPLNDLIAFKENNFYFNSADLATIKAAIEQWYAVRLIDADPSDSLGPYHFGPVPRDLPLNEVLEKVYKLTGHRFQATQRP